MTVETSVFDRPIVVPEDFASLAVKRNWPDGLLRRACELRVDRGQLEFWLTHEFVEIRNIEKQLRFREQLMFSTMRVREATWQDDGAVADLYADSPEDIGEWEVTVERSPYPFAQFRLQEHVNIQVLEDRGILLAIAAHSGRNTIVEGKRVTAHVATAWRTRRECRGKGYSNLLRTIGGPACSWFGMLNYWYFRSGNFGAYNWLKALAPNMLENAPERDGDVPGLSVTVHHLPAQPFDGDTSGVRAARRADVRRCIALINRTHRGLDLFRPYSEEFMCTRLDDPYWEPKPPFWVSVYGWRDYFVLEEKGRVVACAGLWDRGKHIREVWRHKLNGEQRTIETTALMDFGYESGREDAMARLMRYLVGRTHELGRGSMMAAIEQTPALLEAVSEHNPAPETRAMGINTFNEDGITIDVQIRRPYTDLAYW